MAGPKTKRKKGLGADWANLARKNPAEFNRQMRERRESSIGKPLDVIKGGKTVRQVTPKRNAYEAKFQPKQGVQFNRKAVAKKLGARAVKKAILTGKANPLVQKEDIKTNGVITGWRYIPNRGAVKLKTLEIRKKAAKGKAKLQKVHAGIVQKQQQEAQKQAQQQASQGAKSQLMFGAKLGAATYGARRLASAVTSIPGMLRRGGTYRF